MLGKLLDTFEGNPDVEWWSHILSWNGRYGSVERNSWSGWMIVNFLWILVTSVSGQSGSEPEVVSKGYFC